MSSTYTVYTIRGKLGPFTKAELQAQLDAGELNSSMRVTEVETGNDLELAAVCGPPGAGSSASPTRRTGSGVQPRQAGTTLHLELDEEDSPAPAAAPAPAKTAPAMPQMPLSHEPSPAMHPTATVGTPRPTSAAAGPAIRYASDQRPTSSSSSSPALRIVLGAIALCFATFAVLHFSGPGPTAVAEGHSIIGMWEIEFSELGYRRTAKATAALTPGTTARSYEEALRECRLFYEFREDQTFTLYISTWEGTVAMGSGEYELLNRWGERSIALRYRSGLEEGWHVEVNDDHSLGMSIDGDDLGRMVRAEQ